MAVAHAVAVATATTQAVDVQDLDALDALHRPHRFADDGLGLFHQLQAQRRCTRIGREHVVRLVHPAQRLGLDLGPHAHSQAADLVGVGVGSRLRHHGGATVGAGFLLGRGRAGQAQRLAFGGLRGADQVDGLLAFGHLDLARGEHLLFGRHCGGAGHLGFGLRLALRLAFARHGNGALLLGQFQRHAALDLGGLDRTLLGDAVLLQRLVGADARGLNRLLGGDLRALGLLLALRAFGGDLGALAGARHLYFTLLRQARVLALAVDAQAQLLGFEVLVADGDQRVLLDVVTLLLAVLDLLGQPRQALGVEGVAGVEELHAGLVQLRQRRGFQLQAVHGQVASHGLAHLLHVSPALLVQLFHRHLGRGRAQRVDELAFHQLFKLLGLHRAQAQRLRRSGHRFRLSGHAHVELGDHVHAHAVLGDQSLVAAAHHLQAQRVHVHRDHVVHDGQHEGATVQHHLLPAQAGAHEGALLAAAQVQPVQQPHADGDDNRDDDQSKDETAEFSAGHGGSPKACFSSCGQLPSGRCGTGFAGPLGAPP